MKSHMLLLAHLERLGEEVPAALQADLRYVLAKSPLLLEEMIKLATAPKGQSRMGWMVSDVGLVIWPGQSGHAGGLKNSNKAVLLRSS